MEENTTAAVETTTTEDYMPGWDAPVETEDTEAVEVTAEEQTESPETEQVTEQAEDTTEAEADQEAVFDWSTLELKHLKDTKTLGEFEADEAKALFQKGLDYDRKTEKLDEAKKQLESFEELARLYDMDLNKVSETLMNEYFKAEAERQGKDADFIKEKYNLDREKRLFNEQKTARDKQSVEQEQKDAQEQAMMADFITEYPDVQPEDVPKEVWDRVKNGSNLVDAYGRFEAKQQKDTIAKLQKQIENMKKSPVKSTTKSGQEVTNKSNAMFKGWDD